MPTASLTLRCLTLNLWGAEEPLAARMAVVERGIAALGADVVALQEVREVPGRLPNQAGRLADALGMHWAYAPATPFDGGQEGLAVLSRLPIAETSGIELPHARADERRILLSARLAHPAGAVWVHTTHLNYRLAHGRERADQVVAIDEALRERHEGAGAPLPQILMGDFNARPESDEIRFLTGLASIDGRRTHYQDAWAVLHPELPGVTWARSNPYTKRLEFLHPDRRLDYVFATSMRRDGRGTIHSCHLVFDRPDPEGTFASDHYGVLAEVQVAPG